METKQISSNNHFLASFKDNYNIKIIDCSTTGGGRADGLALMWNNCNLDINIISYDLNYIDFLINSHNLIWRGTGIYGYPIQLQKFLTCRLINDLSQANTNPNWLIFGDFNICMTNNEKWEETPLTITSLTVLETLLTCAI
jgi:hypothetical protein